METAKVKSLHATRGLFTATVPPPREPDTIVRSVRGISLAELVERIKINANGEYDALYVNADGRRVSV